jgi:UDP-glucuronate 4-epimerase
VKRRYLVTGALGAIGAWTTKTLLDRGYEVAALDVGDTRHRLELALGADGDYGRLEIVQGDITNLDEVERVLSERAVTNVIHLAALQIPSVRELPALGALVNVCGTVNVFEAVRRVSLEAPVVYASSVAVFGAQSGAKDGSDVPATLYGVFKRTNEATAIRYFEDYAVSSIGLRPHTVYGPGRDQGLTSAPTFAMLAAAARVPYEIPFSGRLQFQYLPDVAEAFVRASELEYRGASVHTLDGPVAAVDQVVAMIEAAADVERGTITWRGEPLPLPGALDGTSFVDLLGGSVNRPLGDGIADAVARFRDLLNRGRVQPP